MEKDDQKMATPPISFWDRLASVFRPLPEPLQTGICLGFGNDKEEDDKEET